MHCNQTANWQYVHRAFAHFEEDVMENGHRDTVDDSLLEKGNRSCKEHKRNVMQGYGACRPRFPAVIVVPELSQNEVKVLIDA